MVLWAYFDPWPHVRPATAYTTIKWEGRVVLAAIIRVWVVLDLHDFNILYRGYGQYEVIFHPFCHWRA